MDIRKCFAAIFLVAVLSAPTITNAAAVSGQGTWETTLLGRDLDGNATTFEAYYDTVLDITWLADANTAGAVMNWADANTWAAGLNIGGVNGWRLPNTNPIDGTTTDDANSSNDGTEDRGYNISAPGTLYANSTASEMAHLFYNTLGNLGYCEPSPSYCTTQSGWGLNNTGPFSNIQGYYWSATEYAPLTYDAWHFMILTGEQNYYFKDYFGFAWAVHDGDISAVPVPAAIWLFGSGLIGLIGLAKRKKNT